MNYDFMRANPTCYAYHFDEKSPYDNEWGGLAHHSLENIFIWNVLRHTLSPAQQEQAATISSMWLRFAGGQEPWQSFGREQKMMIFEKGRTKLSTPAEDPKRGYSAWKQIREMGGAELVEEWGEFAFQLCIMKRELLDPSVAPRPIEVGALDKITSEGREPGVL